MCYGADRRMVAGREFFRGVRGWAGIIQERKNEIENR